ncbi:YcjF family protein [Shewanella surugensis]|uniref:YcjF family protein n=2 Tax=Shewanella surugensis TaxID=212020 RepID=A0ABT0L977_9GAMM|nr:TIGR01620 family protein [Shewanella surugensis]MCL1123925.1 YcjF family protein [Shewanella surugensis]
MTRETSDFIKPKQTFSSHADPSEAVLKPSQHFDDVDVLEDKESQEQSADGTFSDDILDMLAADEGLLKERTRPKKGVSWLAKLTLLALFLLISSELYLGLQSTWVQSSWLFSLYSSVILLVGVGTLKLIFTEWRKLLKLKGVEETQQIGMRLSESMQMGEADTFIEGIVTHLPPSKATEAYYSSCKDDHNDAEKLILFDQLILQDRDEIAKKLVRRFAAQSALLLAASPLAVLDMAFMLWRNQRMINELAACYGIELGYCSRIKLIRGILMNIIYAGTSEIITDVGTQLLSVEMSGKLSARLAQGLGGGLLTARLGYQAMALCRPLAFDGHSKPKLSHIHKELLLELKALSSSAFPVNTHRTSRQRKKDFTP